LVELQQWLQRREKAAVGKLANYLEWPYQKARIMQLEANGDYDRAIAEWKRLEQSFDDRNDQISAAIQLHLARLEFFRGNIIDAHRIAQNVVQNFSQITPDLWFDPASTAAIKHTCDLIGLPISGGASDYQTVWKKSLVNDEDLPRFHADEWPHYYDRCIDSATSVSRHTLEAWRTGWLSREYPNHVCGSAVQIGLARHLVLDGEIAEAHELCSRAVVNLDKSLGPSAGQTLDARLMLARIKCQSGENSQARQLALQVIEDSRVNCGKDSPDTLRRIRLAAQALSDCGDTDTAMRTIREVVEQTQSIRGWYHPELIDSIATYVEIARETQGDAAAYKLLQLYLPQIQNRYPELAEGRRRLAALLASLGET
jgi:tetratricopeptide (TPR) repeat protein